MKFFKTILGQKEKSSSFWIQVPKSVDSREDYDNFMVETLDFISSNVNIKSNINKYV